MKLTLTAEAFLSGVNSVLACASSDRTFPALNCVFVKWDEVRVAYVATNRYVLGEQTDRRPGVDGAIYEGDDVEGQVSVPVDALKAALTLVKAAKPTTVELVAEGAYQRGSVAGIAFEEPSEFPRYESLFPKTEGPVETMAADPLRIAELAGPKVKGRPAVLRFTFAGSPNKPVTVARAPWPGTEVDESFRGLLMPIKLS